MINSIKNDRISVEKSEIFSIDEQDNPIFNKKISTVTRPIFATLTLIFLPFIFISFKTARLTARVMHLCGKTNAAFQFNRRLDVIFFAFDHLFKTNSFKNALTKAVNKPRNSVIYKDKDVKALQQFKAEFESKLIEIKDNLKKDHAPINDFLNIVSFNSYFRESIKNKESENADTQENPDESQQKHKIAIIDNVINQLIEDVLSLKKYQLRSSGVCAGISYRLINKLFEKEIKSEKDLIILAKKWKTGGSAKASLFQTINMHFTSLWNSNSYIYAYNKTYANYEDIYQNLSLKKFQSLSTVKRKKTIDLLFEKTKKEKFKREFTSYCNVYKYYSSILRNLVKETFFKQISTKETIYTKENKTPAESINNLKKGYYFVQMRPKELNRLGHAVVFIKKNFGSYFFDSNIGLIKCVNGNIQETLNKMMDKYNYSKVEFIQQKMPKTANPISVFNIPIH